MRLLIVLIFLMSNSFADEILDIKNLVIHQEFKKYDSLTFLNAQKDQLNLDDYKGNLILLNFWATWCLPCKEEMPSLDLLNKNLLSFLRILDKLCTDQCHCNITNTCTIAFLVHYTLK